MIKRLPASFFLLLGMILIAVGLLPLLRYALGIEDEISISFLTLVMFCIAGVMAGLSGMILILKRLPESTIDKNLTLDNENQIAAACHASGLLLYTGLPFANFLMSFWLWSRYRHQSKLVDQHGKEAVNFQITIYLYLLLVLFLIFITFGFAVFLIPIPLAVHLLGTFIAIVKAWRGKSVKYLANLSVTS